jgi:hypothetical protein
MWTLDLNPLVGGWYLFSVTSRSSVLVLVLVLVVVVVVVVACVLRPPFRW